ncbi:hypothetical protein A9Q99_22400 [Gammaproteobacteria bacterium 45_16_T64]|nr:hypothetical protein A9Q99_22400 [Gammaproteobacteria bacterium 45_16_T64]
MSKKVKRRRYRIIRIIRPYMMRRKTRARIQRKIIVGQANANSTRTNADNKQSIESESTLESSLSESSSPLTEIDGPLHPSEDNVVNFPSSHNPYDHLISQLPTLLRSIPNLIEIQETTDTPETKNINRKKAIFSTSIDPDVDTQQNKTASNIGLQWRTDNKTDSVKSTHWFNLQTSSRDTSWLGLSEQSYRKIRLGGIPTHNDTATTYDHTYAKFFYQKLEKLANTHHYSLTWLLLLMSPTSTIRDFLRHGSVQNIGNVYCSIEKSPSTILVDLPLQDFLNKAIDQQFIDVSNNVIEGFLSCMTIESTTRLSTNNLNAMFNDIQLDSKHKVFEIRHNEQTLHVEIEDKRVQIYGLGNKPIQLSHHIFLDNLRSSLVPEINSDVYLRVYTTPNELDTLLENQLREAEIEWQHHRHLSFIEYLNLDT